MMIKTESSSQVRGETLFLQGKQYPVAIRRPSLPFYPSYYIADSHNTWENDTVKIVQLISWVKTTWLSFEST